MTSENNPDYELVPLKDAVWLTPSAKCRKTLSRWRTNGIKAPDGTQVELQCVMNDGMWCTCIAWIRAFEEARAASQSTMHDELSFDEIRGVVDFAAANHPELIREAYSRLTPQV